MIEFGKTLRESREARGFTVAQLAEATKLMPSTIADLENEDFSRIAAPIYGRGFVKLYCDAVGIDAKPLITEFMEMLEGNREPVIRERPAAAVHEKAPEPEPEEPAAEPGPPPLPASAVPAVDRQDAFRLEAETRTIPVGGGEPPAGDPFAPPDEEPAADYPAPPQGPSLSRYAAPIHTGRDERDDPPSFWRIGLLAVVAAAVIAGVAVGIRALYRATTPPPKEGEPATAAPADPPADPPKAKQPAPVKREPQKIPALYID